MAHYQGNTYGNERMSIDGNEYHNCTFNDCELVYKGEEPPSFVRCSFNNIRMSFGDAAGRTVAFLQGMANPDSGLQQIVRDTFPLFTND